MSAIEIEFKKIEIEDSHILTQFLLSEEWDFFVQQFTTIDECVSYINKEFFSSGKESFLVYLQKIDQPIGLIELFDVSSEPWFTMRIKKERRQKGIGTAALEFLTDYIFNRFPEIYRINASTREDNVSMQNTFKKCLWVKEGYLREALKAKDGRRFAALHYGVTRKDWNSGTVSPLNWKGEQ